MNEQDHKYVQGIKAALTRQPEEASILVVKRLLAIIDCLDKQLTEVVEAGEPLEQAIKQADDGCSESNNLEVLIHYAVQVIKEGRRLAQKLKEVEHE